MDKIQNQSIYKESTERELIKMWEDIKGNNTEAMSRSLLKSIAKNDEDKNEKPEKDILYAKQMWDSEKGEWIPFDLWGAHFFVNHRKEYVAIRIYRPLAIQPECGPILRGWQSLDSSYLNEKLKETTDPYEQYNQFKSFSGQQVFYEMIKQDQQEYKNEGRHNELPQMRY